MAGAFELSLLGSLLLVEMWLMKFFLFMAVFGLPLLMGGNVIDTARLSDAAIMRLFRENDELRAEVIKELRDTAERQV